MNFKGWTAAMLLSLAVLSVGASCRIATLVAAREPTVEPTRTPRATFTPKPSPTDTPVPTDTPLPPPTATATKKPVVVAPKTKTPTPVPPPTSAPATPKPQFPYGVSAVQCVHAGNNYIKGSVYASQDPRSSIISGMRVVMSDAPDGAILDGPIISTDSYTFTRTAPGQPKESNTHWYVWLVDTQSKRISDVGGPVNFNTKGEDAPDACSAAFISFYKK